MHAKLLKCCDSAVGANSEFRKTEAGIGASETEAV